MPFKAASACACFSVKSFPCSAAFFFSSSTNDVASFNFDTPPCKTVVKILKIEHQT